jgi:hypothetical protein
MNLLAHGANQELRSVLARFPIGSASTRLHTPCCRPVLPASHRGPSTDRTIAALLDAQNVQAIGLQASRCSSYLDHRLLSALLLSAFLHAARLTVRFAQRKRPRIKFFVDYHGTSATGCNLGVGGAAAICSSISFNPSQSSK